MINVTDPQCESLYQQYCRGFIAAKRSTEAGNQFIENSFLGSLDGLTLVARAMGIDDGSNGEVPLMMFGEFKEKLRNSDSNEARPAE